MVTFQPYQETANKRCPDVRVTGFLRCHHISTTDKLALHPSKTREDQQHEMSVKKDLPGRSMKFYVYRHKTRRETVYGNKMG